MVLDIYLNDMQRNCLDMYLLIEANVEAYGNAPESQIDLIQRVIKRSVDCQRFKFSLALV